ncbi:Hyalin [Holothuria leucospilota]|uniref:Hyalin n=1 Tax=Holothuria leucospilota TaxID=206669 RepID=A0A9Q1CKC3_HOLLE|nr:Hyalin [Holothuria leucospilota]
MCIVSKKMFSPLFLVDDSPPRVECGPDITRETPMATGGLQVNFEECTATDDSGTAILLSRSSSPGQFFPIGSTEVVYTFTDPTGNTATGSFTITVVGGEKFSTLLFVTKCERNYLPNIVTIIFDSLLKAEGIIAITLVSVYECK